MHQGGFYEDCDISLVRKLKQEPVMDTIEDDIKKIKDASRNLYPEISLIPLKKNINFRSLPSDISSESKHFLEPTGDDLQHPHCKRRSLPLEKCPICKKFFRRMNTHLQKHAEQNMHFAEATLTCRYCPKTFNNLSNLNIHMRTHTGTKPYICGVCSKGFAQSCNLTNHMRTHTGEKPFKCPYCDRAFTQSGNLSNHIRLHLDQKPFKCHFCDRAFTQSGNLNSHIRNNHKNETVYS